MTTSVDASNSCIPAEHPLVVCVPPLPSTTRGEPVVLDSKVLNNDTSLLVYGSGRLVIVRDIHNTDKSFVYRGHQANVTCAKFSPTGAYVASGDSRGKLRVWSYDQEEHLCKLDLVVLNGHIQDVSWDGDSKRICVVGIVGGGGECARVIQWDTGVSCGELYPHARGKASCCSIKPTRPMRLVTGGREDGKCILHKGPPFQRVFEDEVCNDAHGISAHVFCVRYSPNSEYIVSVSGGGDKSICLYEGKTMTLLHKMEHAHEHSIYACAWNSDSTEVLTCSADGTVKLWSVSGQQLSLKQTWTVAAADSDAKIPIGGMQLGCAFLKDDVPVSVSMNGQLNLLKGEDIVTQTGHEAAIAGLAIDHERGFLYTGDTDGVMVQWSIDGKALGRFKTSPNVDLMDKVHGGAAISCLVTVMNGDVLSAGWDDAIRIAGTDAVVRDEHIIELGAQPNAMSCGTNLVAVVTVGGLLLVKDGKSVSSLFPVDYEALCVCVSKDDSTVYVGGGDCKIYVYSISPSFELTQEHVIENGHLKPVYALALSNDQTKLASGDVRDVCVFDLSSSSYTALIGKSRWCFHTQRIKCLAWSPDDSVLASGGADDSIYLWSLAKKMKRVHYRFAHRGGVTGLEFLGGERMILVSVGADACLNQWDVKKDVQAKFG